MEESSKAKGRGNSTGTNGGLDVLQNFYFFNKTEPSQTSVLQDRSGF